MVGEELACLLMWNRGCRVRFWSAGPASFPGWIPRWPRPAGRPSAVMIGGEAGVGKSRLVSKFAERSRGAGARVLPGGCLELGAEGLPFARRARISLGDDADAQAAPGRAGHSRVPEPERLGLTAREFEVLRLVAAGRSNREIASELFISAKTASVHMSNILGKLGVTGRGEAAATAHRLRLFDSFPAEDPGDLSRPAGI